MSDQSDAAVPIDPKQRPPTIVDALARQTLALADQIKATRAALDALDTQVGCVLAVVAMLQDVDAQRRAAASARAAADEEGPKMPLVFGRPVPAPTLPTVPADIPRT